MPFKRNSLNRAIALFLWTLPLAIFGCAKQWDPDSQFEAEVKTLKEQRAQYKHIREQEARRNLDKFNGEVLLKIVRKVPVRDLDLMLGYKYKILAQTNLQGDFWERRQYHWEDVVESKWGLNSSEFELCKKERVLFVVTINSREVTGIEY